MNNTISGLATIRSTKNEDKLNEEFYAHSDFHTRSVMAFMYVNRWLGVRLGKSKSFLKSKIFPFSKKNNFLKKIGLQQFSLIYQYLAAFY